MAAEPIPDPAPRGPIPDPAHGVFETIPDPAPRGPIPDPAHGVFETLLARGGRVQALGAHIERLARSVAGLYGATLPAGLAERVRCAAGDRAGAYRVRVDAQPSDAGVKVALAVRPVGDEARTVVRCRPVLVAGGIGEHKWADRRLLESLAKPGAVTLIVDRDGELLEAAWANVWLIEGTALITPPADGRLLPGVIRQLLLELAPSLGLQPRIEAISLPRARAADAIFLTSSVRHAVAAELEPAAPSSGDHPLVSVIRAATAGIDWA
jgi:para-aminobenzoate synthetase/4-amino-4-deoxychorismate lyase